MNILFLDQKEPVEGKVVKQDDSHILIEGVEKNTSGFRLLTEKGYVFGKYEEFTTLYKEESHLRNGYSRSIPVRAIESNDGSEIMKKLRPLILFVIGGLIYVFIELTARGRSHWTMFVVGGLAFFLVGCINEKYRKMPLVKQMAIGAIVITTLEFLCGYIVNLWLGWNVWDYSNMPLNLFGQICLPFTVLWFFLTAIAVILDDWIRHILWNEKIPHYKLF